MKSRAKKRSAPGRGRSTRPHAPRHGRRRAPRREAGARPVDETLELWDPVV